MVEHEQHLDWARKELPPPELRLMACLLSHSALMPRAFELVRSTDFTSVWAGRVFEELIAAQHAIHGVQPEQRISHLSRSLKGYDPFAHARLEAVYEAGMYDPPQLFPNAVALEHFALEVVESARDRYQKALIEHREFDETALRKMMAFERRIERAGEGDTYIEIGVTGDALLSLSSEPVPDPVVSGLLWPGHVNVLAGRTKIGKTFLVCNVLVSLALCRDAWTGAPRGDIDNPPRILMLSRDDTSTEIARRLRHLEPQLTGWAEWLTIAGKELKPQPLDEDGLLLLRTTLDVATRQEKPFAGIVLDPYTHFLPPGGKLNEDETASQLITSLEALCSDYGCWIWVLHHMRKRQAARGRASEMEDEDLLDELRGSGAIANLSRAVAFLEKREGHIRRLVSFSNVGPTPRPQLLQVCDEGQDRIDRWLPITSTATPIGELMGADEEFNFTDYARRRLGIPFPKKPSQAQRRLLLGDFHAAVADHEIRPTVKRKNAQMYRLEGKALQSAQERSALGGGQSAQCAPPREGAQLERSAQPPCEGRNALGAGAEDAERSDQTELPLPY